MGQHILLKIITPDRIYLTFKHFLTSKTLKSHKFPGETQIFSSWYEKKCFLVEMSLLKMFVAEFFFCSPKVSAAKHTEQSFIWIC